MSFPLGQSPGPEVKVLSKILPLPQHSVFDCVHILSWNPVHPVVRGFRGAQLKRLEGREENQATLQRRAAGRPATHAGRRSRAGPGGVGADGAALSFRAGARGSAPRRGPGGSDAADPDAGSEPLPRRMAARAQGRGGGPSGTASAWKRPPCPPASGRKLKVPRPIHGNPGSLKRRELDPW